MKTGKYKTELEKGIYESFAGNFYIDKKVVEKVLNDFYEAKLKENMVEKSRCPYCGSKNYFQLTKSTDKCSDCNKCWDV